MKKIAFMHQASIGDMLMVTPVYRAVKECYPDCRVIVVSSHAGRELMLGNPHIDTLLAYRKGDPVLPIIKSIRRSEAAVIFDYHYRNALYALLALIPKRIGYGKGLINVRLQDEPLELFEPLKYLAAVKQLGIHTDDIRLTRPVATAEDRAHVDEICRSFGNKKFAVIVPFSLDMIKDWMPERYREIIKRLQSRDMEVVILGSSDQTVRADVEFPDAINLCGKTNLRESAEMIARAEIYISGCTSMLHVCSTTDTHAIAIYGPSMPEQWAPKKNCTVITHRFPCSPCHNLSNKPCIDNRCLKSIAVDEVWTAVERFV